MGKLYDPRMHTAEHILNQTMIRLFNTDRCIASHIEKKKSKCDYFFSRALTSEELLHIENQVNDVINRDLSVIETIVAKDEGKRLYDLHRVPVHTGNDIRLIEIGDYDLCPCIGEHVQSTKEIGFFKISSINFDGRMVRIIFRLLDQGDK